MKRLPRHHAALRRRQSNMRYYTVCEMTPSHSTGYRSRNGKRGAYSRVYARAPNGFLFHDTEHPVDIADLRAAVNRLADLFETEEAGVPRRANQALAIRVNKQTIAVSFSTDAMPRPVRLQAGYDTSRGGQLYEEWLSKHPFEAWVIPRVNDLQTPPSSFQPGELYDHCIKLERLTDLCPCPLQDTGECFKTLVAPKFKEAFPDGRQTSWIFNDYGLLRRVRYKVLPGDWLLTSPKTTVGSDFTQTFRPWDYHEFSNVKERKDELSERAVARHSRDSHRKAKCTACAFAIPTNGGFTDCGSIHSCTTNCTEENAWRVLLAWLHDESGFMDMQGFTPAERNLLIRYAGATALASVFSHKRKSSITAGGFYYRSHTSSWAYQLVSTGGDMQRSMLYGSYQELRGVLPQLPEKVDYVEIPDTTLYAFAAFGRQPRIYSSGKPSYERRVTKFDGDHFISTDGAAKRYVSTTHVFNLQGRVKGYVTIHPTYRYPVVGKLAETLPDRKVHLAVVSS